MLEQRKPGRRGRRYPLISPAGVNEILEGARRDAAGAWLPALSAAELTSAAHDNMRNLGLEAMEIVNLRKPQGRRPCAVGGGRSAAGSDGCFAKGEGDKTVARGAESGHFAFRLDSDPVIRQSRRWTVLPRHRNSPQPASPRAYRLGAAPITRLNATLNAFSDSYPTAWAISPRDARVDTSRSAARIIRHRVT